MAASQVSGEKIWRMPLEESYWEMMKSGVADMVNTGGRQGGAITAALFLKQVMQSSKSTVSLMAILPTKHLCILAFSSDLSKQTLTEHFPFLFSQFWLVSF